MEQKIIAINSGSSSLKFQLFRMPEEQLLVKGLFERIGLDETVTFSFENEGVKEETVIKGSTHEEVIQFLLRFLISQKIVSSLKEINGIGHRVAHGGEYFNESSVIDVKAIKQIKELIRLAPLHNSVNVAGIEAFQKEMPHCPQVAVFDTSFHQTMEAKNYIYPIPYSFYKEDKIRRYGFHGTSHQYVALEAAKILEKPLEELKIISCHLGNGSSICAINNGKSVITSMGFTPLAGLMMGTRCGDIDPSIIPFLQNEKNMSPNEVLEMMNSQSGLKGISMLSNDLRDIGKAIGNGNEYAELALDMFVSRIRQTIGAYSTELGGVDLILFTAGIGENDRDVRRKCCANLSYLGVEIDEEKNEAQETFINHTFSKVKVMIIPTDEERMIVRDTYSLIK